MLSAEALIKTFEVAQGVYAIGMRENRVTLFSQQTRALNLVWAISELEKLRHENVTKIAIVGAGAAGLTAAAALLGLKGSNREIVLFERQWDLCPMQLGCDGRWLHPRIYDWPSLESRNPSAGLPVLNWSEGRASDVARNLVEGFNKYRLDATERHKFSAFFGAHYLKIDAAAKAVTWVGTLADFDESPYALRGSPEGATAKFDAIIVAAGFGFEKTEPNYPTPSYWRNDQLSQLHRESGRRLYVVSGFGDGALVDVCRLTIDRFRQDTVIYELFGKSPDEFESFLKKKLDEKSNDLLSLFDEIYDENLLEARMRLNRRVREDTSVALNISGGKDGGNPLKVVFGAGSSVLNRLLIYLLFRCGAIAIDHCVLGTPKPEGNVANENVIIRHGCDTPAHLRDLFEDYGFVEASFNAMYLSQSQAPLPVWPPGYYPVLQAA